MAEREITLGVGVSDLHLNSKSGPQRNLSKIWQKPMLEMHFWPKKWMRDTCKLSSPQRRNWGKTHTWTSFVYTCVCLSTNFTSLCKYHTFSYHLSHSGTLLLSGFVIVVRCTSVIYTFHLYCWLIFNYHAWTEIVKFMIHISQGP